MLIRNFSIILCFTLLLCSCSFFNEQSSKTDLIKKDRDALAERVNTFPALLYKYIKINTKISEIDSLRLSELKAEFPEIDQIIEVFASVGNLSNAEKDELSVMDYIRIFKAYKKAKEEVEAFDEDILPSYSEIQEPNSIFTDLEIKQQKVSEHVIFAIIGLIVRDLGTAPVFYELSMVGPEQLPNDEFKATFLILRNFMLYEKGLYYLSEHELTQNINWIEDNPDAHFNSALNAYGLTNTELGSKMRAQILIFNYLLRGLDRLKMDNKTSEMQAMKDFEMIINTASEYGIDNEIIQAIKVFFYLKNEDSENAIVALNKLKESKVLSKKEKESINEAISFLKDRKTDRAFNGVFDKVFLSRIIASYMYAHAKEIDWKKVMRDNDIKIPTIIEEQAKTLNHLLKNINKFNADKTLEEAQKDLKDTSLNLWEKSKSILE